DKSPWVSVADAFNGSSQANRLAALSYLRFARPDDPRTLELLVEALRDRDCREAAINHFEALGAKAAAVVDSLVAELVLENRHEVVRKGLIRALGKIGPASRNAVPTLREFIATFGPHSHSDVED